MMLNSYLQAATFALVAILVPVSLLAFSRLVRPKGRNGAVETSPYESAEETIGSHMEVMQEYLHYFSLFLAFVIVVAVIIIWSTFTRELMASTWPYMILLIIFSIVLELVLLGFGRGRDV